MTLPNFLNGESSCSHAVGAREVPAPLWEQWSGCRHCSWFIWRPEQTFAYSQQWLCWCSKACSQAEQMMQSAVELGLEGDSPYFAKTGLSEAEAAMAGDGGRRGRGSLQPGCLVALGCRRGVTEPAAKSCPWPRGWVGGVGCGCASSSMLSLSHALALDAGLGLLAGCGRGWCGPAARANCHILRAKSFREEAVSCLMQRALPSAGSMQTSLQVLTGTGMPVQAAGH